MTRGQKYSISILVANELDFKNLEGKDIALKYLETGKIPPSQIRFLEEQSHKAITLILTNDLLNEALKKSEYYFEKYNIKN